MENSSRNPVKAIWAVVIFLAVTVLVLKLCGCATSPSSQESVHRVIVTCENGKATEQQKEDAIKKVMTVPYTDPELPTGSYIIGDTGYFTLWAHIGTMDCLNLFKSIEVMKFKKIGKLHMLINSGGGSAFDGMALADLLIRASKDGMEVTCEASGVVASAAVPIFAVGTKRIASKGTIFMIHEGKLHKFLAAEGKDDLRSQQEMLDMEETRYNTILSERSKLSISEIEKMCKRTTWFTAEKAKEWGFVDEIK
ncbi:Clp protease ClpP [Candidatus Magnetobacterium casense]|uniref:Clp protease ClpP n=1 Tax=Candidatus Magnetobacterium casense TaxID=1455061 RepID=A0ABS6S1Y4_9BACT|nr:Clp protease ClpP [Candidatus Magnetobacterium casensis]MBV6342816.1 Clp protease ClpP [Candidatus Magnetobacterium casensis]